MHEFKRRVPLHLKVKLDEKGLPIFSLDDLGTIERANLELQQLPLDPPPKLEHKQGSSLTGPFPVAAVEASPVQGFAPDTKGLPQLKTLAV